MTKILMKGRLETLYLKCSICECLIMTDEYSLNCPCCGYGPMNSISKKEAEDILRSNEIFTSIDVND